MAPSVPLPLETGLHGAVCLWPHCQAFLLSLLPGPVPHTQHASLVAGPLAGCSLPSADLCALVPKVRPPCTLRQAFPVTFNSPLPSS